MTIDLVGAVLSAPEAGSTPDDRRAVHFLPAVRAREVDPEHIGRQARQDEIDGYHRSLVHIYSSWADPWLVAGAAATATTSAGVTVAHRPGVTAPTVAARSFATLDRLSHGRAGVHMVIGSSDVDVRRDGDFLPKTERYRRAAEYLEVFTRTLTSDEPFDFDGEFYQVADAWAGFRPEQIPRPPISIGGSSIAAMGLAARYADTYAGSYSTLTELEAVIARVRALASPLGRELRFWKQFRVILGSTDADAEDTVSFLRARAHAVLTALPDETVLSSAQFARDRERGLGAGVDVREAAARQLRATFDGLIVGSVDRVAEHIAAYRRAGITVINVDALTETGHDRDLRRQLITEITRNETISQP
ncbi:alkanesulfonate monooxygenase SsuD/methylene tetrahydromethanopterin reductase-like flavin-dependent oxidoreductase (luciferase family) [Rhodococcus sp. 27YEA15]|uniref:LLM class flavin-dependent oxidoreductase n=1 Tax=Rhodococcus sp. 27YEA15 TaxID=3156259 RepID=UPI003C7EB05E